MLMETRDSEYFFERTSKEKLRDFYTLFKTRGKTMSYEYFEKKYDTKWTGKEFVGVIVYDSNRNAVAHIGSIPTLVKYKDQVKIACQICDIVTHPDHQKKGLFSSALNYYLKVATEEKIDFLYVFPNGKADRGLEKNGWQLKGSLNNYTFKTSCIPLNKIANKFNLLKSYNLFIKLMLRFISKSGNNDFKNSVIDDEYGGLVKDNNYIFHKNYSFNYITIFKGFKIWWKIDDGFSIGDIERFDPTKLKKLFKTLKLLCLLLGFHNFKIITSNDTFMDKLLDE